MSIESLKEQARRHEEKEEWQKALDLYVKAIDKLAEAEQPDIALHNRVGDLYVRIGDIDGAMMQYESAIDLYMESELPNNAIAVCKKVLRNVPQRPSIHLRIGQIRASQGFLTDARTSFLTYAEAVQRAGNIEEAYRALGEFADLAPEDTDIRMMVAAQMEQHGHIEEAVEQLQAGYRTLMLRGDEDAAGAFEARIHELDPDADVPDVVAAEVGGPGGFETTALAGDDLGGYGDITLGGHEAEEWSAEVQAAGPDVRFGGEEEGDEGAAPLPTFGLEDEEEGEAVPLPTFGLEDDEEGEAVPLPTFGLEDEEDEEEAAPLPTFGLEDEEDEEEVAPLSTFGLEDEEETAPDAPGVRMGEAVEEAAAEQRREPVDALGHDALAERGDLRGAMRALGRLVEQDPENLALRQRMVEYAVRSGEESPLVDAYLELASALERKGQGGKARALYQQVLSTDPGNERAKTALGGQAPAAPVKEVASSEEYVDLGSLILGDDDEEKSTRFVVAYEEPSGDEQADFAKMLSQFKAKVAENLRLRRRPGPPRPGHRLQGDGAPGRGGGRIPAGPACLGEPPAHLRAPGAVLPGEGGEPGGGPQPGPCARGTRRHRGRPPGHLLLPGQGPRGAREHGFGPGVLRQGVLPGHQLRGRHGAPPGAALSPRPTSLPPDFAR